MKKSLIISFLFWFIAEFVFLIIFSFSGSVIAAALFLSLLIISLTSYITCIFSGKCFSATIKFPATAKKSKDTEGTLIINNASHFHFIKVFCCISAKNPGYDLFTASALSVLLLQLQHCFLWPLMLSKENTKKFLGRLIK